MNAAPVLLLTGASGNLGQATARLLHQSGWRTALADRSADRLRAAFPSAIDSPDHYLADGVDLGDAGAVQRLVDAILARFGRLDALVHTVGAFRGGTPLREADPGDWDVLLAVNLRTTLNCCRAVLPPMLRQGRGRIVTIASRAALAGEAGYAAYSASKSGVLRLTESISEEVKTRNITANCLLPGTIDTPLNRQSQPNADFSRWVAPEAIAAVIGFLVSDAASAITGAAIPVYGKG